MIIYVRNRLTRPYSIPVLTKQAVRRAGSARGSQVLHSPKRWGQSSALPCCKVILLVPWGISGRLSSPSYSKARGGENPPQEAFPKHHLHPISINLLPGQSILPSLPTFRPALPLPNSQAPPPLTTGFPAQCLPFPPALQSILPSSPLPPQQSCLAQGCAIPTPSLQQKAQ